MIMMSKGSESVKKASQQRPQAAMRKGKKRSAAEAFHGPPKTLRESLDQHRSQIDKKGGSAKTVDFNETDGENGQDGMRVDFRIPDHDRRSNLKERALALLPVRQKLPIYAHAGEICQKLRDYDVLLLVGETGSGKSTQIPQFLVREKWCQRRKTKGRGPVGGCIAITQPRRVAAISLARRVAEEMGTPLGNSSPASQVGYSVRFDNSTSPSTKIKFLTEGMLLQEMLKDPWLKEYSAVVVDEVHERGVNVDLVLGFLRRMHQLKSESDGRGGIGMKVVIMSATADMERIQDFFNVNEGPGSNEGQWAGFSDPEEEVRSLHHSAHKAANTVSTSSTQISTRDGPEVATAKRPSPSAISLHIRGRQHPVRIHYSLAPVSDIIDVAFQRIVDIHTHSPLPGDVLVFLTGQETVESLLTLVENYSRSIQKDPKVHKTLPKLLILPLFAALPSNLQQRVFQPTPKFTRKVIISTNIAETSITVPGIRHVIDSGKAKRRMFRPSLNLDTLLTTAISRSSANQRSGRAGRDAPGDAYRLYTEADFYKLSQDTEPEILRCDLSQLVLTLKAHGIRDLTQFPFLTPPPRRALERALVHLLQLSALDPRDGSITALGRSMCLLPLPASLARVLIASTSTEYGCVSEIIDIVAALSVENIFLNIHHGPPRPPVRDGDADGGPDGDHDGGNDMDERRERAETARRDLYRREGDHLTLLATVQGYAAESTDRKRWCEERFISHRAMSAVMDVRKQLTALSSKMTSAGNLISTASTPPPNQSLDTRILRCILTGFHPHVARMHPDGQYRTLLTNHVVSIHPSSVLFGRKVEAFTYNELVYTAKTYARGVSSVELAWVGEAVGKTAATRNHDRGNLDS